MTLDANLVPGVTRVNGGIEVGNWVGRPQEFVSVDAGVDLTASYGAVDSNAEVVMRVVEEYGSINMVGTPSGNVITFMMDATTLGANATALGTAVTAANIAGLGQTATVTLLNLSGATLA